MQRPGQIFAKSVIPLHTARIILDMDALIGTGLDTDNLRELISSEKRQDEGCRTRH